MKVNKIIEHNFQNKGTKVCNLFQPHKMLFIELHNIFISTHSLLYSLLHNQFAVYTNFADRFLIVTQIA